MKLINNRFRVNSIINDFTDNDAYIVKDLQQKEKTKFLTIYKGGRDKRVIDYFTEEFETLVNIKHKNLIELQEFDIIETINLKKSGSLMYYYVLNEHIKSPKLSDIKGSIDLCNILKIILELMSVIDYLHFRGYSYKHLSPTNIFVSSEYKIKIRDLANIIRDFIYSHHDDLTEIFIAPEIFVNSKELTKYVDYYSLGMIMKYLLFNGLNIEDVNKNNFKGEFNLMDDHKIFLLNTITNLTHKDPSFRNISLKNHIQNIITTFNLDYDYDLVKERDYLILNTKIFGRDKEINTFLKIDDSLSKGIKKFNGAVITGRPGSGKTKLLGEIAFRYGLLNRSVFHIKGREDIISGGLNIASLLKASFKYCPNELINKYSDDFNEILSQNANDDFKYEALSRKTYQDKYRIFNRLTNYFIDLSKERTIYILIDDINSANDDFINFLNYMLFKLENNRLFVIFTTIDPVLVNNNLMKKTINLMINNDSILHLELGNLTEADTGKFVKAILGMNYVPERFASFMYKESLGNPNYIYYIMKDMYNREELFMDVKGAWDTKEKDYNKIIISIDENHVINSQLDTLEGMQYKILELISLSKDMTTRRILMGMLDIEGEYLVSIVKSLIELKIIDDKIIDNKEILSIYSTELKKVVYSRIDYHRRIDLHKEAAKSIMDLYQDSPKIIMEELIHHLKNSEQVDYALELVLREAKKQSNRYSSYSVSLWEHAYYLVKNTDNDEILNILNTLITIYEMKGYIDLIGNYITKMHKIAMKKNDLEYLIMAKHHQIGIYFNTNQLEIVESLIWEIEEIVSRHEGLYEGRILLLIDKARLRFDRSQYEGIDEYLLEAIKISKEHNILKYLGNIYNIYGLYNYMNGMPEDAIKYFNESIRAFELDGNIVEEIKPINNIGNLYSNVYGEDDEALEYFQKGYKIASKYEFAKASSVFTSNIGDMYYRNFQLKEALRYYETSRNIANEIGDYRGTISSNLSLGMVYLRADNCDKAYEIYTFIKEINDKEPFVDIEVLAAYYNFLGRFKYHFGKFEESLEYFRSLSEITKEYSSREYLWAEANIQIIRAKKYLEYNRDRLEKIINEYQLTKMNSLALEVLLLFALVAVKFDDFEFAQRILDIYSKNNERESEGLKALKDTIDILLNSSKSLNSIESYLDGEIFGDYKLYIINTLADKFTKVKNYRRVIHYNFKALDNILKRAEIIENKNLRYSFIFRRGGDHLKRELSKYIGLEFNKDINYITLDESYRRDIKYNDLIYIMNQLDPSEFIKIRDFDNKYEEVNSIETLLYNLSDDYQMNLDLILNYLGYETLANRGFILFYDEEDNDYTIVSSLKEGDTCVPRENLLTQSNRSSVGILINKNLKNMEDSKYIDLLTESAVSVICVPLFKEQRGKPQYDRRKKDVIPYVKNHSPFGDKNKIYIYLESDSYLNRFEYDKLMLIKHLTNLININIENKYLKDITAIDKLTGVLTRKHFDLQIENLMEKYSRFQGMFSLLMIDIDNFKGLNDTYGHLVGDDVLSIIGIKLKESIRSTDIVARYGGEEFIVILFDTDVEDGLKIAEKIRMNILNIEIPGVEREITVSIGLAQYPEHSQFKKDLIRKADQALYNAKEMKGKNSVVAWTIYMGESINNQDKLAGILTGNTNRDNVNISAVINTAALIESKSEETEKIYEFTNRILEVLEAQYATFIKYQEDHSFLYKTKIRIAPDWVRTPKLNKDIINRVVKNKKGEFLVDWDNSEILDPITGEPQWQSVLVLPLIKNGAVLGLIYLSVPIKEKEFSFEDFNLGNLLSSIFVAVLSHN